MGRYFMHLAYRGAPFCGWQVQPGQTTVQGTLEHALSVILRRPTAVVGAGRTDTGVNASHMTAHFDADCTPDIRSVNSLVCPDITVSAITPVHSDAHARFDATSRTYRYLAIGRRDPFLYPFTWYTGRPLDYDAMNLAAELLLHTDDFTSFAKLHSDSRTNICRVTHARWAPDATTGGMTFTITADRFLRNMVRAVVGTLVDVGRRKLSVDGFREIILARDRCSAGTSMPPQALYLADITYPYPC